MQLYDVGMSSLVAAEMRHLAALGREALPASRLGGTACDLLESRAAELSAAVQAHLWNDELGAFTNRHANGSMSARVSPTSFYPLLASIATDRQAHRLAVEWLTSSRRFCVDAGAQPPGTQPEEQQARSDECFWGLPSISYDDPSYREQDYWRGLVWAPNAILVYSGLRNYDHVPSVRAAARALAEQMRGMLLAQWRARAHVCENYSPARHAANCTGDRFHQWGALAGLLRLGEEGHVNLPRLAKLRAIDALNQQQPTPRQERQAQQSAQQPAQQPAQQQAQRQAQRRQHGSAAGGAAPPTAALGAWAGWRSKGSGWWSWRSSRLPWPFGGGGRSEAVRLVGARVSTLDAPPASSRAAAARDWAARRPGYEQAEVAQAAAKREGQWVLASALESVARHALGAFGAHGIVELDLDQSSELR